jgi:hypothetical protein
MKTQNGDYPLTASDRGLVRLAIEAIEQVLRRPGLSPREIVGLARALHALRRLPMRTIGIWVDLYFRQDGGGILCGLSLFENAIEFSDLLVTRTNGTDVDTLFQLDLNVDGKRFVDGDSDEWVRHMQEMILTNAPFEVGDESLNECLDDEGLPA